MFKLGKYGLKTLKTKKVLTLTYVIAVTLILSVCMVGINVTKQMEDNFFKKDGQYDIIVGKTGSSIGLVMGSLFYNYENQGTIPYSEVDKIREKYPDFLSIEPMAMGDMYGNSPVIGVDSSFLRDKEYIEGTYFKDNQLEVVVGQTLAENRNIKIGDKIKTSHGNEHGTSHDDSFLVVGVLKKENSANDNAVFTSLQNIWEMHGVDSQTGEVAEGHGEHNDHGEDVTETEEEEIEVEEPLTREEVYGEVLKEEDMWLYTDVQVSKKVDQVEDIQTKLLNISSEVPVDMTDEEEKEVWEEMRKTDLDSKLSKRMKELETLIKDKTINKKVEEMVEIDPKVLEVQLQIDTIKENLKHIEAPKDVEETDELGFVMLRTLTPAEQLQWEANKEAELNAELGRLTVKLAEVKEQAKFSIRIDLELEETENFLNNMDSNTEMFESTTNDVDVDIESEEESDHTHTEEVEKVDGREVTSILIRSGNMAKANNLVSEYQDNDTIQAVQTTHIMRKVLENIDLGTKVATLLIGIIGLQSLVILSILTGLFINGFSNDIKTFKIIGYSKRIIMWYMLVQMLTILAISTVLGFVFSRVGLVLMNKYSSELGLVIDYKGFYVEELYTIVGVNLFVLLPLVLISYILLKRK